MTGAFAARGWTRPPWSSRIPLSRSWVAGILLGALLVTALLLRLDAAGDRAHKPSADERSYVAVAAGIRHQGVYGSPQLKHPFHWAPGTPALFALADAVGGHSASDTIDRRAARDAQAIVGTLTVAAAFALAALLAGPWAGVAAAAGVVFYQPMIDATSPLVSETFGAFAIVAALAALAWAWRGGGAARAALAGLALGAACRVRADVLLAALAAVALLGALRWRASGRGPGLRAGGAALAGLLVLLVPWSVFASRRARAFVPITDGGASTLFIATYLPGHGTIFGLKRSMRAELVRRHPGYRNRPIRQIPSMRFLDVVAERHPGLGRDAAISKELSRNLRVYVLGHPLQFARMTAGKVWRMWGAPFHGSFRRSTSADVWVHRLLVALALLGLLGGLWRRRSGGLALTAVAIAVVAAVDIAFVAEPRHAFRLMAGLLAAGAAGWALLLARPREPA